MLTFSELGYPQWGRLGNQMYAYAALIGIAEELGYSAAVPSPSQHQLGCFELTAATLTEDDVNRLTHDFYDTRLGYSTRYRSIEDGTDLHGYFQSERYFPERERVLHEFTPKPFIVAETTPTRTRLVSTGRPLVAVTVRRGDYLNRPDQYLNLCATDYYDTALSMVADLYPMLVISSDDPGWCRQRFDQHRIPSGTDTCFVDSLSVPAQLVTLAACDHIILANSSFSWWAAWLHTDNGLRIAPDRWFGQHCEWPDHDRDPLPDGWTPIAFTWT